MYAKKSLLVLSTILAGGISLAFTGSVSHAEVTADFSTGSVRLGNDTDACAGGNTGALRYNSNRIQYCDAGAWTNIGGGSGAGGGQTLAEVLAAGNNGGGLAMTNLGNITSNGTVSGNTGFYVDGASVINGTGSVHTARFTDDTRYGYFEARNNSGSRGFYLGWGNGGTQVQFQIDAASRLEFGGGVWDMNTNQIHNLGTPTAGHMATTKTYVDSAVSTAQTAATQNLQQVLTQGTNGGGLDIFNVSNVAIGATTTTFGLHLGGPMRQVMSGAHDLWLQGGASTAGGDNRNLAILGADEDSGDTLYINYGAEYAGGTSIGGNILSSAGVIRDAGGGWVRTYGSTGWYNNDYGGGWYMTDSTWIRSYGNKGVKVDRSATIAGSNINNASLQIGSTLGFDSNEMYFSGVNGNIGTIGAFYLNFVPGGVATVRMESTNTRFNTYVNMNSNQIRSLATPTANDHAATKAYVDSAASGATQNLSQVLSTGNSGGGTAITNVGSVTSTSYFHGASGGTGEVVRVGNDASIQDINGANTIGVYGQQNGAIGNIKLGSSGSTIQGAADGNYGSMQVTGGAKGGWSGFSIDGRAVFMHDGGSSTGIYNDVNNQWILIGAHNGDTRIMQAGTERIRATSYGGRINNTLRVDTLCMYDGSSCRNVNTLQTAGDNLGAGGETTGNMTMRNTGPLLYMRDTNHRSGGIHVNNNLFYVLSMSGNDSTTLSTNGSSWPLVINLTNDMVDIGGEMRMVEGSLNLTNQALVGNAGTVLDANGGWVRTYNSTGWYNGTHGGGWHMTDATWVRAYNNKAVLSGGVMRADGGFQVDGVQVIDGNNGRFHKARWNTTSRYGYFEGENSSGTRGFYIGYGNGSSTVDFNLDAASQLDIQGGNVDLNSNILLGVSQVRYTSDERKKKDIATIGSALDDVSKLRGVSYHWKKEYREDNEGLEYGVVAQEVEKIYPDLVSTDEEGMKSVHYTGLIGPLIEAVKELKSQNEAQQLEIEALKKKLSGANN